MGPEPCAHGATKSRFITGHAPYGLAGTGVTEPRREQGEKGMRLTAAQVPGGLYWYKEIKNVFKHIN